MELQIQDLVSAVRKEGIEAANAKAEEIISEAEKKAAAIIAKANDEAKAAKEAAERDIALLKEGAMVGAQQARRDAVLSFKEEVQKEFEKLLSAEVGKAVSGDKLADLIKAALAGEDISKYSAEISSVSDAVKSKLADEIKDGLEIKPSKHVQAGFRLAAKDGSSYFDCTDEAIMEMLSPYFRDLNI